MEPAKYETVAEALRQFGEGLTYEDLRRRVAAPDTRTFDRDVLEAMRQGQLSIRGGRYVARVQG